MDTDSTILAALIGIAGTGIAAFLGSIGYLYKTRQESRKNIRRVLYYLLEIRHAIAWYRLDANDAAKQMIAHADKRLREKWKLSMSEMGPEVHGVIANHFHNLFLAMRPEVDRQVIELFYASLLELAQSHPILAYQVRGREKLKDAFAATEHYYQDVKLKFIADIGHSSLSDSLLAAGGNFKQQVLDEVVNSIDGEISRVSWASGLWDFMHCKWLLHRARKVSTLDFSSLDTTVDELVTFLIANANQSATPEKTTSTSEAAKAA